MDDSARKEDGSSKGKTEDTVKGNSQWTVLEKKTAWEGEKRGSILHCLNAISKAKIERVKLLWLTMCPWFR